MIWFLVWIALELIVFSVVIAVHYEKRQKKNLKRRQAAARLIKEEILDGLLKQEGMSGRNSWRLMVLLRFYDGGSREYVLDPAVNIRFGRSGFTNDVIVDQEKVSANHCILFSSAGRLYVQDLKTSNGTYLIRRNRRYRVTSSADIQNGDILAIGGVRFIIRPFWFDMTEI